MSNGFDYPLYTPDLIGPMLQPPKIDTPLQHMWADEQFSVLRSQIKEFERSLDAEHEVGILLTNFGQSVLMNVTEITYAGPVLLVFKGFVDGREATLIQHINQLSFLLTTIEKEPDRPKRQIGFVTSQS